MGRKQGSKGEGTFVGSTSSSRLDDVIHACGITAIALVGLRVALPFLSKLVGFSKKDTSKVKKKTSIIYPQGPSEDKWHVVDHPVPPIPADYKGIASATLPCSVRDFYDRVVSSHTDYLEALHSKCGRHRDLTSTGWKASGSPQVNDSSMLETLHKEVFDFVLGVQGRGGYCRTMTFVNPKKPPSTVDASCVQRQQFCVYKGDVLVFTSAMNMLNIPFRECFTVNTAWIIKPEGDGSSCSITINLKVNFVKSCMVSAIIRASTVRDTTLFYKAVLEEAATHLASPAQLGKGLSLRARGSAVSGRTSVVGQKLSGSCGAATGGASASEVARHVRVFVLVAIIVGSLVHQLAMHQQLGFVHRLLNRDM